MTFITLAISKIKILATELQIFNYSIQPPPSSHKNTQYQVICLSALYLSLSLYILLFVKYTASATSGLTWFYVSGYEQIIFTNRQFFHGVQKHFVNRGKLYHSVNYMQWRWMSVGGQFLLFHCLQLDVFNMSRHTANELSKITDMNTEKY